MNRSFTNLFHRVHLVLFLSICLLTGCGESANEEQLAQGQVLYEANCAACHGVEGEGEPNWQTVNEQGQFPAPPHDETGHTWHHSDQLLLLIIAEGGQLPGSQMPAYKDQLTQEEMEAILAYIKTFWTSEQRAIQADITQRQP